MNSAELSLDSKSNLTIGGCLNVSSSTLDFHVSSLSGNISIVNDLEVELRAPIYWNATCGDAAFENFKIDTSAISCHEAVNKRLTQY